MTSQLGQPFLYCGYAALLMGFLTDWSIPVLARLLEAAVMKTSVNLGAQQTGRVINLGRDEEAEGTGFKCTLWTNITSLLPGYTFHLFPMLLDSLRLGRVLCPALPNGQWGQEYRGVGEHSCSAVVARKPYTLMVPHGWWGLYQLYSPAHCAQSVGTRHPDPEWTQYLINN